MGKKVDLTQKSDLKAAGKAKEKKVQPAEESSESEGETAPPLKKGKKAALKESEPQQEVASRKEKKPKKPAAEVAEQKPDKAKKAQEEKKAEGPAKAAKKQKGPAKMPTAKVDSSEEDEPVVAAKKKVPAAEDAPVAVKRPSTSTSEAPKKKSKGEKGKPIAAAGPAEPADPTEIYVGGLPYTSTEEEVKVFFSDYGAVENVKFLRKHNGAFRGAGFVKFSNREEAEKATELNGTEYMGRTLKVNFAANKPSGSRPEGGINTVCVRNLSYESTDDSVASFFSQCGTVVQVRVARNQEGKGKGFAHIEFESVESADKAVKLSGQKVDDRPIRVDYAHPKRNTEENKEKAEEEKKPKGEESKPKAEKKKQKGEEKKPKGEEKKPKGEEKKPKGEEKKPDDAPPKKEGKSKKTKL